ncbi:PDR/VanB family oxidoreductase [Actinomycetospora termitidis]|uniref:PDR/VanB family oxidoreductase n=1 Tax=Actinomycetospora termitidis TaxID=3053470 RepID=A0ABT7M625_9PSEU|nr:PDR/VanB family oxidoreductase [Actinomycetospora sp. Odt1-22]MDL5156130.1 PDR/VanB family oxidoreductase [Actinomycetospora sp. Odt1-22]
MTKTVVADGVVEIVLAASAADAPFGSFTPGSHIDLHLGDDLVRQYSLLPSATGTWRVAVLRERDGRGGSAFCHDELAVGRDVRVAGPRNHFALDEQGRYLFLAGGIGITPLISMIDEAAARGADWRLVYAGRTAGSMAFAADLARRWPDRVDLHVDADRGLLDLAGLLAATPSGTQVYACGPAGFLDAVAEHAPAESLHVERFAPLAITDREDTPFEVELARSDRTVPVPPGRSVLEAVRDAGVQTLSSCGEGTCGTCETTVLAGEVDHRDAVLTDAEREDSETMMICVSRARGPRLVLDL